MSESHVNRQKPIAIIIICFIGIINASQLIFMVLSPVSKQLRELEINNRPRLGRIFVCL